MNKRFKEEMERDVLGPEKHRSNSSTLGETGMDNSIKQSRKVLKTGGVCRERHDIGGIAGTGQASGLNPQSIPTIIQALQSMQSNPANPGGIKPGGGQFSATMNKGGRAHRAAGGVGKIRKDQY